MGVGLEGEEDGVGRERGIKLIFLKKIKNFGDQLDRDTWRER